MVNKIKRVMKELSIQEKAKAYDEALKVLHKYDGAHIMFTQDLKEEMFPELAESEDERALKGLQNFLWRIANGEMNDRGTMPSAKMCQEWIAYLEKQGSEPNWCHHKVDLSNCSEEYRKAYYDGWNNCNMQHSQCESEKSDVIKCLINGMKFYYEYNKEATWGTEKFSMKVKDILSWLERQGEQNPTDKVEPKQEAIAYLDDCRKARFIQLADKALFERRVKKLSKY